MGKRSRRKRLLWLQQRKEESSDEVEQPVQPKKNQTEHGFFYKIYHDHYKQLMLITMVILLLAIGYIGVTYAVTGEWIKKDISLSGGTSMTILTSKDLPVSDVESFFKDRLPNADITVRKFTGSGNNGYIIEGTDLNETDLINSAEAKFGTLSKDQYNIEVMGSSLGKSFFRETGMALILAFIFISIVVLITFRNLVPSLFVILAAFSTIISTFAVTQLMGVKISTAGIAAFLMLIGYSIDTDVLLTTRVLKREEGTVFKRTVGAMGTGIMMSLTALAASLTGLILSNNPTLTQIMLIISIGLIFDILYTWLQNAGILRWYLEKKHGKA